MAEDAKARADAGRKASEDRIAGGMERARKKAEAKAKKDAEETARSLARAKQDAADAVEIERRRVQAEKRDEEEEARLREANKKHRARVNREAAEAIREITRCTELAAKNVVTAIALGKIPHVKISY